MIELRPFQKRFLRGALGRNVNRAALSLPRGNGKSTLAAYILRRGLTPGDPLHVPGAEYILLAGSLEQARLVFKPLRDSLPESGYRFADSTTRLNIRHLATGTTLRVVSSKAKTAMGLGADNPIVVADEPGAWENVGGALMADALDTALGKPDATMRVIYIGTLAPSTSGWWHDLVHAGSHAATFVQALQADPEKWELASEIRRVNPLMWNYPASRATLLRERNEARGDTRLAARFKSFRLNLPSADENTTLLTVDDWALVTARPVPPPDGRPLVALDLGRNRSFSAAVALWKSGRCEAVAVAPGIPSIADQEKRDRQDPGEYQRLVDAGRLHVADGLRVVPPSQLVDLVYAEWGAPAGAVIVDRFRLPDLKDTGLASVDPVRLMPSEWDQGIRAVRKLAKDGPLSVAEHSRGIIAASLGAATVANDSSGNARMVKSSNQTARDDVAAALVIAARGYQQRISQGTEAPFTVRRV